MHIHRPAPSLRRRVGLAAAASTLAATLLAGGLISSADADRGAQAAANGRACVGAYRVDLTFVGPDAVRPYSLALHADGIASVSGSGAFKTFLPGGSGVDFSGTGNGAWRQTRKGTCLASVEIIDGDRDGNVSGFSLATVEFRPGARIQVTGTSTALAPDRSVRGRVPVEGPGRRLTAG